MTTEAFPEVSRDGVARGLLPLAAALLFAGGGLLYIGQSLAIHAKAVLAQILLERAFTQSYADGAPVKPWSWADTWPMARLELPRLGLSAIVLEGGSGQALAFGPGHLEGTPLPGEDGASVIAAHRDTHFTALADARIGDEIRVMRSDGVMVWFRITETQVVPWDQSGIDPQMPGRWLVLSTCYPFNATERGTLRYLVKAQLLASERRSPGIASTPESGRGA